MTYRSQNWRDYGHVTVLAFVSDSWATFYHDYPRQHYHHRRC